MAIRAFSLGPLRGLQHAEAHDLGNLVVLSGPNGSGKSSLLELLRQNRHDIAEPGTKVMFVGPHRTWRSSALNRVSLLGFPLDSYGALLESDTLPNFQFMVPQGMQGLQGAFRDANSAEDSPAFVKTSLANLRAKQQAILGKVWEQNSGQVGAGEVPDLFAPFRRLVATLLPHLDFVGVDETDTNNILINFRDIGGQGPLFDIDQLSSGEKAAVALLLPLVERQADQLIHPDQTESSIVPLTMLLDEPEIHLHPLLQLQVLEYLRDLASSNQAQFILTTHSPTILDALTDDELYLISPASISPSNQLSRLTTMHERLEAARELTGSTHLLTRSKPIVFIEGEEERSGLSSDTRLITNLLGKTKSWALVPGRSKKEVIGAVARLRGAELELPGMPVFGIVDSDTDLQPDSPHMVAWPVTMVENFLLDAEAIFETLGPFGSQVKAGSVSEVQDALRRISTSLYEDEIRIRVQRQLPIGRLSIRPDELDTIEDVVGKETTRWMQTIARLDIGKLTEAARAEVEGIVSNSTELDRFHGKKMIRELHKELAVQQAGVGHTAFALMLSAHPRSAERAALLATPALNQIALFFPTALSNQLRVLHSTEGDKLADRSQIFAEEWAAGRPNAAGRQELRNDIFNFSRGLAEVEKRDLGRLASQIGTAT
ncbi:ABC-type multidrug transport system ATPase subunit [Arthrobacter sp. CAN_A212]|uniref:AAA family ATPase n=1 Tax=Arthrobacter sp. CAN_A212 TaxID=2787719 RepID=UPI0018CB5AF3